MTTRRTSRPLSSFLLRVREELCERRVLRYELHDLRSGITLHFASLALLQRHLRNAEISAEEMPAAAPATRAVKSFAEPRRRGRMRRK